jgi:glycosyltransferase involved in cell wall biosynthesis
VPLRPKVFNVVTKLAVGGAQETALRYCSHLDRDRWETVLVTGPDPSPEGNLFAETSKAGVPVFTVEALHRSIRPWADVRAVLQLVRLFRSERPDVVHTHSSKAGLVGRLAARLAGVPVVVHTVHGWSFHDGMPRIARRVAISLERLAARWTSRLVVVADLDRETGRRERIGTPDHYVLVRSGIEPAVYRPSPRSRARAREVFGCPEGRPVVGTVTRLCRQKDPMTMLAAVRQVVDARSDAHCVIIGDGPLRPAVEQLIDDLGLRRHVTLLGSRNDVDTLLAGFDVFALSSLWEGLPRVVVEAMAAGVPVVATDAGGVREVVEDGVSGLVVPVADATALAEGVVRLLDDPRLATRFARSAQSRVQEFDTDAMIERLEKLYLDLLSATRSRPRRRRIARTVATAVGHDAT